MKSIINSWVNFLYELTSKLLEKYKKDKQEIYIDCIKFFLEIKFNN